MHGQPGHTFRRVWIPALLALLLTASPAFALRCGSDLVDEGDLKHEVLRACGEPLSSEIIGTSERPGWGGSEQVLLIEEWIVDTGRNYYRLVFIGNRLARIEFAGRRD